jgi:hypothetical protein
MRRRDDRMDIPVEDPVPAGSFLVWLRNQPFVFNRQCGELP